MIRDRTSITTDSEIGISRSRNISTGVGVLGGRRTTPEAKRLIDSGSLCSPREERIDPANREMAYYNYKTGVRKLRKSRMATIGSRTSKHRGRNIGNSRNRYTALGTRWRAYGPRWQKTINIGNHGLRAEKPQLPGKSGSNVRLGGFAL